MREGAPRLGQNTPWGADAHRDPAVNHEDVAGAVEVIYVPHSEILAGCCVMGSPGRNELNYSGGCLGGSVALSEKALPTAHALLFFRYQFL
jgi:hypothetical protein